MEQKPDKYIGYWVNKVERTMKNVHDKKMQKYDITLSQASILHQLWHKDGLTQKEMQDNLSLRGASVSGLVDTLLKKGLILRTQDVEDARCKRLHLTEEGRKIEVICAGILQEVEEEISLGFSEDEKLIFISWMKKLYGNLKILEK